MKSPQELPLETTSLTALQENLPFWSSLSQDNQKNLTAATARYLYPKGILLHRSRLECTGLVMVLRGRLRVFIVSEGGKEITLYRLFERDVCILTASCIIRNISFDVHVQSEVETEVLLIPTDPYQKLASNDAIIQDFTNQLVSSRFSDVMWVVEQIVFMRLDQRLALHLLEASAMAESDTISITHDAIARDLGSAREVVTRMLNRFQDENLVQVGRGTITLVDRETLFSMSN